MANTFELISSVTVGSGGAASITLSSIPATFTDLCVKLSVRDSSTGGYANDILIAINGSSSSLSHRMIYGTGSATASTTNPTWFANAPANTSTANTFGSTEIYFPNYLNAENKSYSVDSVTENNATAALAMLTAGLRSNTATITSLTFTLAGGVNFSQYSTAYLYGVKNA